MWSNGRPSRRSDSVRRRGFTFLELLLAVALLAIVAATVYASFRATASAIARTTQEGASAQAARVILSRLADELTSTEWSATRQETLFLGSTQDEQGQTVGQLQFTSRSHTWYPTQPPAVEMTIIGYEVDSGPHGLQLWRTEMANPFLLDGGTERVMMTDQLADAQFRYYAKGKWETGWDASQQHQLPDLVEIVLTFAKADGPPEEFRTVVSLPTGGF
jgi:prepilin-type N-terminal cleavage/methylation domain-containing protein